MKKITLFFSFILIVALSFYSCDEAQFDPDEPQQASELQEFKTLNKTFTEMEALCGMQKYPLWAHGHRWRNRHADNGYYWNAADNDDQKVGYVIVSNDAENLYVTVYSETGFGVGNGRVNGNQRNNLDVWISTTLPEDDPCLDDGTNGSANAGNTGGGPYHAGKCMSENGDEKEATYVFSYSDLGLDENECPHDLYVVVRANTHNGNGYANNEAYAGYLYQGDEQHQIQNRNRWGNKEHSWMYLEYETVCCSECYCSFGYNYHDEEAGEDACIYTADKFPGVDPFRLWSNRITFSDIKGKSLVLKLVANADTCTPLDTEGNVDTAGGENNATVVGSVEITGNEDGSVDVQYFIDPQFDDVPVQLDLYIGSERVPEYEFSMKNIYIVETTGNDHTSEVYQTILFKGETSYKFENLPWPVDDDSTDVFITPHAAVGSCPDMPGMEGNDSSNDTDV